MSVYRLQQYHHLIEGQVLFIWEYKKMAYKNTPFFN